jgi:hypothetical protein
MMWMFYRNEILHICGYWKMILFWWLWTTLILGEYDIVCVGKIISFIFPNIWKTSKSEVVRVLCINLKAWLSWTLNWKQTCDVIKWSFFTIADDSDFSWLWGWLRWKAYLISFPCKWRMSKSNVVCVMCVNLNERWSWTLNWKQTWKINKHD